MHTIVADLTLVSTNIDAGFRGILLFTNGIKEEIAFQYTENYYYTGRLNLTFTSTKNKDDRFCIWGNPLDENLGSNLTPRQQWIWNTAMDLVARIMEVCIEEPAIPLNILAMEILLAQKIGTVHISRPYEVSELVYEMLFPTK